MDPQLADLSKTINPEVLGRRLRSARIAAGLTQAQAAGGAASTAYVSRIEAGQRRPDLKLLTRMADRLGTTVEELLLGVTRDQRLELRYELDTAELALVAGDAAGALRQVDDVLQKLASTAGHTDMDRDAHRVRAAALEAVGDLDGAILELEDLLASGPRDLTWIRSQIALSRCLRESGDLTRAVDAGELAAQQILDNDLDGTPEAIQLALTVAGSYFELGETAHASRMCRKAIEDAERVNSPMAKASAYWNSSVIEGRRGRLPEAVALARKALTYFETADDSRRLAQLRTEYGSLLLRTDPPDPTEAKSVLEQAGTELDWSSSSVLDQADQQLALARANLLLGDCAAAAALAAASYDMAREHSPLAAADALVLQGQVAAAEGRTEAAAAAFGQAALALAGAQADRRAAELWFELGGLLDDVGDPVAARDAYRRAAISSGLAPRTALSRVPERTGATAGR